MNVWLVNRNETHLYYGFPLPLKVHSVRIILANHMWEPGQVPWLFLLGQFLRCKHSFKSEAKMSSPRSWSKLHLIFNGKYSPSWGGLEPGSLRQQMWGRMHGWFLLSTLYYFSFLLLLQLASQFPPFGVGEMEKAFNI